MHAWINICYTRSKVFTTVLNLEIWSLFTDLFLSILQSRTVTRQSFLFISTISKHIINNNNNNNKQILVGWNHWIPPTLFLNMARGGQTDTGRGILVFYQQAHRWAGETATCHLEREAAADLLGETARWSGWPCLRSAQLLLPLIFNRCVELGPLSPCTCRSEEIKAKAHTHTHTQMTCTNHCH